MFHALQALAAEGLVSRVTLLANHVIGAEPAAMERLKPHAGKRLRITLQGWPTLLPALPALAFLVTPAGLVEWCGLEAAGAVELEVSIDASNPLALAARTAVGERPKIDVSGDAQFAADVSWLAENLRWDVQDDLERLVGPGAARELARFAAAVAGAVREAAVTLGALARRGAHRRLVPRAMRHVARLVYISWIFLRYGLDELALSSIRQRWARALVRVITIGRRLDAPRGERLRRALERLGPIFVKFGQVLSTRRDLLPADIADELARLQDRVPPFAAATARRIVERSFGKPIDAVFARFDEQPVASASIAQVHFAALRSGREVAVKVLRPGMLPAIENDLALMRTLAGWIERFSADGKRLKPREVVAEFDNHLHDELDLVREAANATQLRRNMASLGLVMIPEMVWDHCSTDVLVMERMHGVPISQIQRLREAGVDLRQLSRDGVTIFFTQVFRDGFFHADMHPGNIQVSLDPASFGRYIALDFGIVGTLTEYDKDYLAQNFIAFFRRDYKRVAELHVESGWVPAATRIDALESAIRAVCEPQFERPLKDISLGQVLLRLFQTSRRFNVEIQPQLVLLQKTLLNIEGLGRELDPELDLWSTAKPFLERWMNEQIGWRGLTERLQREAPRYAQLIPDLPRLLHQRLTAPPARDDATLALLLAEQRRTQRLLRLLLAVLVLAALAAVGLAWRLSAA